MRGKIFALSMVIILFSLFGFGVMSASQYLKGADVASATCLGSNCSPLGHIVFHVYLVPSEENSEALLTFVKLLPSIFYNIKKITLIPATPPPNFLLNS